MSLDWQTEEHNDWDDQDWQEKPEKAVSAKPPWHTVFLIIVLLAAAGAIVYQQVAKRLEATMAAVETDIFAAHNLLSRAAANEDGDLGKAVLSGRDLGWSQVQTDLLASGLFYENPTFGLALADPEAAYAPLFREDERFVDLQLDPNLNGAVLSYVRDYLAFTEAGIQTVTLQQTAVYRRGNTRWLLAPPLDDFWGGWQTTELDNITYIFPQRDAEIMAQLTTGLGELVATACADLPELDCVPAVQIRFDTNPESLLAAADLATVYDANLRLELPAPTLVGVPINDDGYEALLYAYGTKLVSALIGHSVGYTCCERASMFQALMIYQLSELGLADWPVSQQTQQDLANSGVHTELLFPYWSSNDFSLLQGEGSWQMFGFIDFLLKQYVPQAMPMALMGEMNSSRAYQSWLLGLREETEGQSFGAIEMISRDWWFYALTQAEATAVSPQPISLPAQDLQIGCIDNGNFIDDESKTVLFRYDLGNAAWMEEFAYEGLAFFNPLPQDDGVVLQLVEFSEEQYWQTLLWQNGGSVEVMNLEDVYSISLGQMDPNGRFLLSYFGTEEEQSAPEPLLIDIESCLTGRCDSTAITQTPHWSPDSQWMLLTDSHLFENTQYMVDGRIITLNPGNLSIASPLWLRATQAAPEAAVAVGEGRAPFWLDTNQFGYIRTIPAPARPISEELVLATVDNLEPESVLSTAVLNETIPGRSGSTPLSMQYAMAHPTDKNILVVMAATQAGDGYLFQFNRQTQQATLLFSLDLSRGEHSLGFSPDGRFLVASGSLLADTSPVQFGLDLPFGAMHVYDFSTGNLKTILINTDIFFPAFTFDWSADGNWLAFARDNNVISLMAPAYDYQQMIFHEQGSCISLAWINPLSGN